MSPSDVSVTNSKRYCHFSHRASIQNQYSAESTHSSLCCQTYISEISQPCIIKSSSLLLSSQALILNRNGSFANISRQPSYPPAITSIRLFSFSRGAPQLSVVTNRYNQSSSSPCFLLSAFQKSTSLWKHMSIHHLLKLRNFCSIFLYGTTLRVSIASSRTNTVNIFRVLFTKSSTDLMATLAAEFSLHSFQ